MKKKMLSPQALAALASGKPLASGAVPEAGAEPSAGTEQVTEGVTQTEEVEEKATDAQTEETRKEDEALAAAQSTISEQATQIEALNAKIAELEAVVATADSRVKAATEEASDYRSIVTGQIAGMRVALGLSAVDLTNWTNEAVLREYNSVAESFEKALPEGPQVPETSGQEQKSVTRTSLDLSKLDALGF